MQLFATASMENSLVLGPELNFQGILNSLKSLVVVSTGDPWQLLMHDLARRTEGCIDSPEYSSSMCGFGSDAPDCVPLNGCGSSFSYLFFISLAVVTQLLFANLFIAVIIEACNDAVSLNYGNSGTQKDDEIGLTAAEYKNFCKKWATYDVDLEETLGEESVFLVVAELEYPLGFGLDKDEIRRWKADRAKIPKLLMKEAFEIMHLDEREGALASNGVSQELYQLNEITTALGHRLFHILYKEALAKVAVPKEETPIEKAERERGIALSIVQSRVIVARTAENRHEKNIRQESLRELNVQKNIGRRSLRDLQHDKTPPLSPHIAPDSTNPALVKEIDISNPSIGESETLQHFTIGQKILI